MFKDIIVLVLAICIAFVTGKLVSKLKLPAILGWLVTGMAVGPHALGIMNSSLLDAQWFHVIINICEVFVGMLIGTELIYKELKKSGKQIVTITLFEGMMAFVFVSVTFFLVADTPLGISLVFGAIALATAPAPSLSIVKEYNAKGSVSKTLIPLAALDDILAVLVFFLVIGFVSGSMSGESVNVLSILLMIIVPVLIGIVMGIIGSKLLKKDSSKSETIIKTFILVVSTVTVGIFANRFLSVNVFIVGISLSAVIANTVSEERLHSIIDSIKPVIGIALMVMIVNLGAPLDYNLIFGAGILTFIYIVARGIGKVSGAYLGGKISKADKNVCKYLGFALLPHSGVSLVFTGIAVTSLSPFVPEYATMLQGTIAAAAVINEIIAVFLAKQAFKMAGEIGNEEQELEESYTGV